jgi:TrkA domain protein
VPNIDERALPGVGVCHEFDLAEGRRIGVLTHRTGRRELLVYDADDPDSSRPILTLEADEAATLAQLLGAPRVNEKLAAMQRIEGLAIDWLQVPAGWRERTIGEAEIRSRTGSSVVAVAPASGPAVPGPDPATPIAGGDTVIAVGTEEAIERLRVLLSDG